MYSFETYYILLVIELRKNNDTWRHLMNNKTVVQHFENKCSYIHRDVRPYKQAQRLAKT